MIRNCILFERRDIDDSQLESVGDRLKTSTLRDGGKVATGVVKNRIDGLRELAKNEKLEMKSSNRTTMVLGLSCNFRARRIVAAGNVELPFVPVVCEVWAWKKNPFIATFDAGRSLSGVATALLSYAACGDPGQIGALRLSGTTFASLFDWLVSARGEGGEVLRATLQNVESEGSAFKQIVLSSRRLEKTRLFKMLFPSAEAVSNMTFVTPPLKASGRPLCCKLSHYGGITIYSPNPLPSEISEVLGRMQEIIEPELGPT